MSHVPLAVVEVDVGALAAQLQGGGDELLCRGHATQSSPTSVEPVKASLRKPGCSSMYWPDLEPEPVITLNTPAGITSLDQLHASSSSAQGSGGWRA